MKKIENQQGSSLVEVMATASMVMIFCLLLAQSANFFSQSRSKNKFDNDRSLQIEVIANAMHNEKTCTTILNGYLGPGANASVDHFFDTGNYLCSSNTPNALCDAFLTGGQTNNANLLFSSVASNPSNSASNSSNSASDPSKSFGRSKLLWVKLIVQSTNVPTFYQLSNNPSQSSSPGSWQVSMDNGAPDSTKNLYAGRLILGFNDPRGPSTDSSNARNAGASAQNDQSVQPASFQDFDPGIWISIITQNNRFTSCFGLRFSEKMIPQCKGGEVLATRNGLDFFCKIAFCSGQQQDDCNNTRTSKGVDFTKSPCYLAPAVTDRDGFLPYSGQNRYPCWDVNTIVRLSNPLPSGLPDPTNCPNCPPAAYPQGLDASASYAPYASNKEQSGNLCNFLSVPWMAYYFPDPSNSYSTTAKRYPVPAHLSSNGLSNVPLYPRSGQINGQDLLINYYEFTWSIGRGRRVGYRCYFSGLFEMIIQ